VFFGKLARKVFEQEDGEDFLFEHSPGEQPVGNLNKELETALFENFAAILSRKSPQVRRVPAVRFDVLFEEPLHALGMLGGTVARRTARISAATFDGPGFAGTRSTLVPKVCIRDGVTGCQNSATFKNREGHEFTRAD
jgi:hypothetical protein